MPARYKRIIITRIPGADWENPGEPFAGQLAATLKQADVQLDVFSVRDLIYEVAEKEDIPLAARVIHRASDEKVRLLRRLAFRQLEDKLIEQEPNRVSAIITRATSYADSTQEDSLCSDYLKAIQPDLFVVVIDDPVAIYQRLPKKEDTRKYAWDLKIKDIVSWMRYEVRRMRELAHEFDKHLYVIPRLQVSALADLITTDKKTAYLSYPMSLADIEIAEKKKKLLEKLKEKFIVFDPECMGSAHDESLMTVQEQGYNRDSVKKRDEQWFITFNSEYVIVYLPDRQVPAHGSQTELDRASEQGKHVWVVLEPSYTDAKGRVSPFIDRPPDLTFVASDELQYFLDLSDSQREVYGFALKEMWGFKRQLGLLPLLNPLTSAEREKVFDEFFSEFKREYGNNMARTLLPQLTATELRDIATMCWSFNKPLWENEGAQTVLPLSGGAQVTTTPLKLAAKVSTDTVPTEATPSMFSIPANNDLSEDEAFSAIFPNHETSKSRAEYVANLEEFLKSGRLGSLASRIDFLRHIREEIRAGKYKPAQAFQLQNLAVLFSDYERLRFRP